MGIFWTVAFLRRIHTLDIEHFNQCTTQLGILVLNEMEKLNSRTTQPFHRKQQDLDGIFH